MILPNFLLLLIVVADFMVSLQRLSSLFGGNCFVTWFGKIETVLTIARKMWFLFDVNLLSTLIWIYLQITTKKCDALRSLTSVFIWRLHDRSNACKCMLARFSTFLSILSVCLSQYGILAGLSNVKLQNSTHTG